MYIAIYVANNINITCKVAKLLLCDISFAMRYTINKANICDFKTVQPGHAHVITSFL